MEIPLRLETLGFDGSDSLREIVEANVAKLERHYGRIIGGRVAIKAPDEHHKQGEPYAVSISLTLPGERTLDVSPSPKALDRRQANLIFAVEDAFRRADRQLGDEVSRRKAHR